MKELLGGRRGVPANFMLAVELEVEVEVELELE
jgi:hypothetical protein